MDARTHITRLGAICAALCLVVIAGCRDDERGAPDAVVRPATCPEVRRVEPPLAHVASEHRTADYWIERQGVYGPADDPLITPEGIARHNLALAQPVDGATIGQVDLLQPIDREVLDSQLAERLTYVQEQVRSGSLVDRRENRLSNADIAKLQVPEQRTPLAAEWVVVDREVPLRCGPYPAGLYRAPVDPDFDRNLCSTLRSGEVLQLLERWPNGMVLARTPYAMGWVDGDDVGPRVPQDALQARRDERESLPFTRRAVVTEAFSLLGAPYGWGGKDGGYDCSRFLLELFGRFGIDLPRHSARQARAGTFVVDVADVTDLNEKRLLLEAAARRGVVLLHFPGHIMLYLGTTEEGVPMAIHAFSEFVTPCDSTELETINRVDRVEVTDLTLGEGSSREDFLTRVTAITVLGASPGRGLVADATVRPSAPVTLPVGRCTDAPRSALFTSPARPDASRRLRVIAATDRDPGAASLVLFGPDDVQVDTNENDLDGPPFGRWVEVRAPAAGRWTAVLADGDRVIACERLRVAAGPAATPPRVSPGPAWEVERGWGPAMENLYAVFVEQLFRDPTDDDVTWPDLQTLIGSPERNLLHDYREPGEDEALALEPDCADLPYFLRAYFAWKLALPFVYRTCTRGRPDAPPTCEPVLASNLDSVPDRNQPAAFRRFARRMANVVHSSSPRTLPTDDETDFYPVRLGRTSMRPGTVYADPYGHVLVVARWVPQGATEYGVLVGADAQPDGTVGRRRFWRGSFLFTPDTERVGAGFKRWRPVRYDPSLAPPAADPEPVEAAEASEPDTPEPDTAEPAAADPETPQPDTEPIATGAETPPPPPQPWRVATNADLQSRRGPGAWSDAQYRGSSDDFYATMQGLINPRPLDPVRMQKSLVDALEESVQRRLSSVQNGEDFMKETGYALVPMPFGAALFLTSGPWEDYSTPSRDMRLLISVDAVTSFADTVAAHPERFGVSTSDRDTAVRRVRDVLETELRSRRITYTRSDGTDWSLTLADVVARAAAMEVAYNPNDCVEVRWGAPEGSEERLTCQRRAPDDQRQRMEKYRAWFATRERPG